MSTSTQSFHKALAVLQHVHSKLTALHWLFHCIVNSRRAHPLKRGNQPLVVFAVQVVTAPSWCLVLMTA